MIDYNLSKLAQQEYEARVRSLVPVQDFDDRLYDDRKLSLYPILSGIAGTTQNQRAWLSRQAQRLMATVNNGLSSLSDRAQSRQNTQAHVSLNEPECETVPC
jgi:hypothetical protein